MPSGAKSSAVCGFAVERATGRTFVRISGYFTSVRVKRQASTCPRGHSKLGYGDNGVGCRRSIKSVKLVVRSNRGAAVRHARRRKIKREVRRL